MVSYKPLYKLTDPLIHEVKIRYIACLFVLYVACILLRIVYVACASVRVSFVCVCVCFNFAFYFILLIFLISLYSPGIMLVIMQRQSGQLPLEVRSIDTGEVLQAFTFALHRTKRIDFIEQFQEKLLIKQEGENLQIFDVCAFSLSFS